MIMLTPCIHAKLLSRVWFFWNPMDCHPPGASVHGILQRRILERVAMSSSRGSSRLKGWTRVSRAPVLQVDSLLLCPLSGEAHTYSTDHCFCITMQENAQKVCEERPFCTHRSTWNCVLTVSALSMPTAHTQDCVCVWPWTLASWS